MELSAQDPSGRRSRPADNELDLALAVQCLVAWAGEAGEEPRLGWWRCDMVSEYGGKDLMRLLTPETWAWSILQAARETAKQKDFESRKKDARPDDVISLFHLGFAWDEPIEERLRALKASRRSPVEALPQLALIGSDWDAPDGLDQAWDPESFWRWIQTFPAVDHTTSTVGRRLKEGLPDTLGAAIPQLVAALNPPSEAYPLPHFRRSA